MCNNVFEYELATIPFAGSAAGASLADGIGAVPVKNGFAPAVVSPILI